MIDLLQAFETQPMTTPHLRLVRLFVWACAVLALCAPAAAQEGAIRIIVGYPAGATSDALTRVVAERMSRTLKQTVIVENKAGAGGTHRATRWSRPRHPTAPPC